MLLRLAGNSSTDGLLDLPYLQHLKEVESANPDTTVRAGLVDIPIPAFLLNLEQRTDRRDHTLRLLSAVGFSNVSVHKAISWQGLSWNDLVAEELVDGTGPGRYTIAGIRRRHGEETALKFSANALNHFELHSQALRWRLPVYAVFEDDLLPASALPEVNRRIVVALDQWPPDGDTLHLELCFEACADSRYSSAHPNIARSATPHCTAAVVFRLRAAERIVQSIRPAFKSINGMFAAMAAAGALTTYNARPLAFFQDAWFGSDIAGRGGMAAHGVSGVVCSESKEALTEDTELRFVAVARRLQHVAAEAWAMPAGGLHRRFWGELPEGEAAVYYTMPRGGGGQFNVEVMRCHGGQAEGRTWELHVGERSVCYGAEHVCAVELVRESADGSEIQSYRRLVLVQRRPLGA